MDGLDTLITIQIVYIIILFLLIRATIRKRRNRIFHWVAGGLYLVTISWLIIEYLSMPEVVDGGYGFALGIYSMIIPGILVFSSLLVFQISKGTKGIKSFKGYFRRSIKSACSRHGIDKTGRDSILFNVSAGRLSQNPNR